MSDLEKPQQEAVVLNAMVTELSKTTTILQNDLRRSKEQAEFLANAKSKV